MAKGDVVVFRQKNKQYFVYNTNKDPYLCKLLGFRINYGISNNNLNSVLQKLSAQGYQYQIIGQIPSVSKSKSSGNSGGLFIAPTQSKPKQSSGKKSTSYSGPYARSGNGWHDDTWVPGLPSSRFYRKRKH